MTSQNRQPFNMAGYCVGRAARATPSKAALLVFNVANPAEPCETWTFTQLEDAIFRVAATFSAKGSQRGDRIAIWLGNSSQSALLFFAAIAGGFVALPLSDQLTVPEVQALLLDSGAAAIATSEALPAGGDSGGTIVVSMAHVAAMRTYPKRTEFAQTSAEDPAFLIYTSGTTARPKGVLHAHRSALGRRPMYQGWYGIGPDDRMLHAGAFN
jgi:acyl-coenzyme A synthetase/AMP-(fatty) acid ligase